jgi:hypothetical protein
MYSIENLPPPATIRTGTTVVVTTPTGENIATVVNGAFHYLMPFVTNWAGRPSASSVPAGTELQVTDYGNQKWVSDGVDWKPEPAFDATITALAGVTTFESLRRSYADAGFTLVDWCRKRRKRQPEKMMKRRLTESRIHKAA